MLLINNYLLHVNYEFPTNVGIILMSFGVSITDIGM